MWLVGRGRKVTNCRRLVTSGQRQCSILCGSLGHRPCPATTPHASSTSWSPNPHLWSLQISSHAEITEKSGWAETDPSSYWWQKLPITASPTLQRRAELHRSLAESSGVIPDTLQSTSSAYLVITDALSKLEPCTAMRDLPLQAMVPCGHVHSIAQ